MKEEVINLIIEITDYQELRNNPNVDLIEEGIIDSLAFIELLTKLEEKFDIEIQPTQVESSVWRSIDKITEMVKNNMK